MHKHILFKEEYNMKIKAFGSVFVVVATMAIGFSANAGNHAHGHSDKGHMMDQKNMGDHAGHMEAEMREVMAQGRVNKVMAGHGMVNINHEPIPEMSWPKMNMNFKTQPQVSLDSLEPGQQVEFKLLIDGDNNYVIKEIIAQ
ncbi:unnamed protein product [Ectocarpus sp. 12 AP-2014]